MPSVVQNSGMPVATDAWLTSREYYNSVGNHNYKGLDDYRQWQLAQYNNSFNYWAQQQANEYNSPVNQVARLREAGLNPNFNSIDGTGNTSPLVSKATLQPKEGSQRLQSIEVGINAFNSLLRGVAEGVDTISQISGMPADIPTYRRMINQALGAQVSNRGADTNLKLVKYFLDDLELASQEYYHGYNSGFSNYDPDKMGGVYRSYLEYLSGKYPLELENLSLGNKLRKIESQYKGMTMSEKINYLKSVIALNDQKFGNTADIFPSLHKKALAEASVAAQLDDLFTTREDIRILSMLFGAFSNFLK